MRSTRQGLGIAVFAVAFALGLGFAGDAAAERGTAERRGTSAAAADVLAGWVDWFFSFAEPPSGTPAPDPPDSRPPDDPEPDGGPIIEPAVTPPVGPG